MRRHPLELLPNRLVVLAIARESGIDAVHEETHRFNAGGMHQPTISWIFAPRLRKDVPHGRPKCYEDVVHRSDIRTLVYGTFVGGKGAQWILNAVSDHCDYCGVVDNGTLFASIRNTLDLLVKWR